MDILRQGTPARKTLDGIEKQISQVLATIAGTENALLPLDEAMAGLSRVLDGVIENRSPMMLALVTAAAPDTATRGRANDSFKAPLTLADLAMLFGKGDLLQRVGAIVQSEVLGAKGGGLPAAERAARVGELRCQLEKLEQRAEAEVMRLEGEGHTVLRREDADVGVLFDVWAGAQG